MAVSSMWASRVGHGVTKDAGCLAERTGERPGEQLVDEVDRLAVDDAKAAVGGIRDTGCRDPTPLPPAWRSLCVREMWRVGAGVEQAFWVALLRRVGDAVGRGLLLGVGVHQSLFECACRRLVGTRASGALGAGRVACRDGHGAVGGRR
jgi:hypothetical protein